MQRLLPSLAKITFLLFAMIISGCAAPHKVKLWDAMSLAEYPEEVVLFRDKPNGKVTAGLQTADIKRMIHVAERVEKAAGPIRTGLVIEEGKEPNAFSFITHEQQVIAVNVGIINLLGQDQDAMAALIGHELAHLYLDHSDLRRDREENRIMTSVAMSFALGIVGIPVPVDATDTATTAVTRAYSREDERAADKLGVSFMAQAGFDPWGAVHLQEKLAASSKGAALPFMSTHPAGAERIENMKQLAASYKPEETATP